MRKPKKLKRIPSDLVAYIVIKGEDVRDANDKMLIVSYAHSKLDTICWYIDLLEAGSKNYVVPHSKEFLINVKNQILDTIKQIIDKRIPPPSDPSISSPYPKGYEG